MSPLTGSALQFGSAPASSAASAFAASPAAMARRSDAEWWYGWRDHRGDGDGDGNATTTAAGCAAAALDARNSSSHDSVAYVTSCAERQDIIE